MANNHVGQSAEGQKRGFASLLGTNPGCGVLAIDARCRVLAATDEAARMLGLSMLERPPAFASLPASVQEFAVQALSSVAKLRPEKRIRLKLSDGTSSELHLSAATLQTRASRRTKPWAIALVLEERTPAKRIQDSLAQLDRLATLGTLAATMTHEIRNALVPVRTFVDLLLEKNQDAELADMVRREMSRIDSIVSRMLRFAGPKKAHFSAIGLHEVLDHSLRLIQRQLDDQSVVLEKFLRASPDRVQGDEYQLQQVFVNLLLNALEAMGPQGKLTVMTEAIPGDPGPSCIRVIIRDTGIGIAQEYLERVFEPFFTTKPSGTGLGLPITRRIIQEHGGSIQVQSQPGEGTSFSIRLPVLGAPGSHAAASGRKPEMHHAAPAEYPSEAALHNSPATLHRSRSAL